MKLTQGISIKKRILVIHGPNVNLLAEREAGLYGKESFDSINRQIVAHAQEMGVDCKTYHSNIEGDIVTKIQLATESFDGIVLNAGSYSHYSIAIRDAVAAVRLPTVEVHTSNIHCREEFRRHSVLAEVCAGQVVGFGKQGYFLALNGLASLL